MAGANPIDPADPDPDTPPAVDERTCTRSQSWLTSHRPRPLSWSARADAVRRAGRRSAVVLDLAISAPSSVQIVANPSPAAWRMLLAASSLTAEREVGLRGAVEPGLARRGPGESADRAQRRGALEAQMLGVGGRRSGRRRAGRGPGPADSTRRCARSRLRRRARGGCAALPRPRPRAGSRCRRDRGAGSALRRGRRRRG